MPQTATHPVGERRRSPSHSQLHMVGESEAMLSVFEQIRLAATSNATVVVMGESGTGKELVALALHRLSKRSCGPFIDLNAAALPATLMESELFGHVKGAYTGAAADRSGCFEAADGGTLFIDEIGELELAAQAKLLRVLETCRIQPIGSTEDRSIDVRVIAATNRSLQHLMKRSRFRRDLYYRLSIITILLPPLRERRSDIPLLIDHFLDQLAERSGRDVPAIDDALMEFLVSYAWPGNVRQLRNCLESMVTLCQKSCFTMADRPKRLQLILRSAKPRVRIPVGIKLEELEKHAILQTLAHYHQNLAQAASSLGISVRTLQRKLKGWNI